MFNYRTIRQITLHTPVAAALLLSAGSVMAQSDGNAQTKEVSAEDVVATVNGEPISALALQRVTEQLASQGQQPNRDQIIDELINLEILTQAAEAQSLDKNDNVATALKLQYTQTMANAYLGEFSAELAISDDDIQAEYDKQVAQINATEYKASHILLETEEKAKEVIAELEDGGDFVELAKTHSTGPTGGNGGDLGWFQPDSMVPEFSNAVATLETGGTTAEPVKTEFGWHVIQLTDTRESAKPALTDEVKQTIQANLLRDAMAKQVESLRDDAEIELK